MAMYGHVNYYHNNKYQYNNTHNNDDAVHPSRRIQIIVKTIVPVMSKVPVEQRSVWDIVVIIIIIINTEVWNPRKIMMMIIMILML